MFDESFVRAARIREYSAEERLDDAGRAVEPLHPWESLSRNRHALVLLVLMALAFGTAIFLGVRHPYRPVTPVPPSGPLRTSLIALTPTGPVPPATDDALYTAAGADHWAVGAAGITLPRPRPAGRFTAQQVERALDISRDYLIASSLDTDELSHDKLGAVQHLLVQGEVEQFKRSLTAPADNGTQAATGWVVRLDVPHVVLADDRVRVRGTVGVTAGGSFLRVDTDHTMVYTVRPVGNVTVAPSLFTVRRALRLTFTAGDLRLGEVEVDQAAVQAGPLACGHAIAASFRPLLTGQTARPPTGTDPYDRGAPIASACHPMAAPPLSPPYATQPAPRGLAVRQ